MILRFHLALAKARRQDGLTIVEITVAIGIFAIILIIVGSMLAGSLRGLLHSKQRSVATAEAEAVLETARNVDFDLELGLATGETFDPALEPGVTSGGPSGWQYTTENPCSAGTRLEAIKFLASPAPAFQNHIEAFQSGSTQLTRYVYVTDVDENCPPDGTPDAKRVIVRVVFERPGTQGASNEVRLQTLVSSTAALPTALPPLAGLTHAFGASSNVLLSDGLGADIATPESQTIMELSRSENLTKVVTTSRVECVATTARVGGSSSSGGQTITAVADDDPLTTVPDKPPPTSTSSSVTTGSPYAASTVSTAASCEADARKETTAPITPLPLSNGSASMTQAAALIYPTSSLPLGIGTLLGLGSSIDLLRTSGSLASSRTLHTETTTDDPSTRNVSLEATSALGETKVLAGSVKGTGFSDGLLRITPHEIQASATANSGTSCPNPLPDTLNDCSGAAEATVSTAFDVFVFDPAGNTQGCTDHTGTYCRINVTTSSIPLLAGLTVARTCPASLFGPEVSCNISVTFDGPTGGGQTAVGTPGGEKYEALFRPVSATVRFTIVDALDVQIEIDLGEVLARACHGVASGATGCL